MFDQQNWYFHMAPPWLRVSLQQPGVAMGLCHHQGKVFLFPAAGKAGRESTDLVGVTPGKTQQWHHLGKTLKEVCLGRYSRIARSDLESEHFQWQGMGQEGEWEFIVIIRLWTENQEKWMFKRMLKREMLKARIYGNFHGKDEAQASDTYRLFKSYWNVNSNLWDLYKKCKHSTLKYVSQPKTLQSIFIHKNLSLDLFLHIPLVQDRVHLQIMGRTEWL